MVEIAHERHPEIWSAAALVAVVVALAACSDQAGTAVSEPSTTTTVSAADTSSAEATTPASLSYTETELQVTGSTGRVGYDVLIPQIEGGNPAVTAEFNESMRAALQDQIDGSGTDAFTLSSRSTASRTSASM